MLEDFVKENAMPVEVIEKYRDRVSEDVVNIWQNYGTGSFCDEYFRIINPDDYIELIKETYFDGENVVPVFVTPFADVLIWEEDNYIGMIKYKNHDFNIVNQGLDNFFDYLQNYEEYWKDYFDRDFYKKAREKLGSLKNDESYGFSPLLCMGGRKALKNVDIVNTRVHIELISQMVGGVGLA